jgi:putative hydroxymethylpyrimidine transport system substrate-binding protein
VSLNAHAAREDLPHAHRRANGGAHHDRARRSVRRTVAALSLLALTVGVGACGGSDAGGDASATAAASGAKKPQKVNFVVSWNPPGPQHMEILAAKAKGYFEEEGLDVNIHGPSSATDALKLLISGKDKFGLSELPDLIVAREQGVKVIAVTAHQDRRIDLGIMSRKKDNIQSPKDLVGKTVALTPLPGNRARFNYMLEKNGIDKKDVKVVTVQFDGPQVVSAGRAKAADATSWYEVPLLEKLTGETPNYMAFGDQDVPGGYFGGVVVTEDYAKKNPDTVRKVVRAVLKGQQFVLQHPDEAIDLLADNALKGNDRAFLKKARTRLNEIAVDADTAAHGLGWANPDVWQRMIDWSAEVGLIKKSYPASEIFTNDYLTEVKQP